MEGRRPERYPPLAVVVSSEPEIEYTDEPPHAPVVIEETLAPEAFADRVQRLREADEAAEASKKRWGTNAGIAFGVAIVCFVAGGPIEVPYAIYGVPAGILTAVMFLIVRSRLGRADVDDRKVHVLTRLVDALRPELHRKRPVSLWADFNGYDKAKPLTDTTSWSNSTGVKTFEREWLRLSMTLLDGTRVDLRVKTKVKRKQKSKRKYTKMKDTVVEEVGLQLTPPKGQSLDPGAVERARATVASGPLTLVGMSVKPRQASLRFRCPAAARVHGRMGWDGRNLRYLLDGHKALHAVLVSYRAMAIARQGAA